MPSQLPEMMCGIPCALRRMSARGPLAASAAVGAASATSASAPAIVLFPLTGLARYRPRPPRAPQALGLLVLPELLAHHAAHLADGGVRGQGGADRPQQVARPARH